MIQTVRHRGLKRLYEDDDSINVRADQINRISEVLSHLDSAVKPSDINLPGYLLHPLKDALSGWWSIPISGNWRIIFRFEDGDVFG